MYMKSAIFPFTILRDSAVPRLALYTRGFNDRGGSRSPQDDTHDGCSTNINLISQAQDVCQ